MKYQIKNAYLIVEIEDMGAQLSSIQDADGLEYLWQGDAEYWGDRAPNLFPYIGIMSGKKYTFEGREYEMDIHGFAKDSIFVAEQKSDSHIIFSIENTDETYKHYPFAFRFEVSYELEGNQLLVTYAVQNKDGKAMYFGIGGHPGFNVPLETGNTFEDYYLEFDEVSEVKRVVFSGNGLVMRTDGEFDLQEGKRFFLCHDLFDNDAIVLGNAAKGVTLKCEKGSKAIRVTYPDMTYIGFWQCSFKDAPYLCIEPWSSLPSREGIVEDLKTQPGLICLEAQGVYKNQITIEIIE